MSFENQVVILTGASRGIGKETAFQLASQGAILILNSRSKTDLEEVKNELFNLYPNVSVLLVVGDITDDNTRKSIVNTAIDAFGHIDILINNAGGNFYFGSNLNINPKYIHSIFNLNVMAPVLLSQLCLKHMVPKQKGSILFISTMIDQQPDFRCNLYASSKRALTNFAKSLAIEFSKCNIRINILHPGNTETDMTEIIREDPIEYQQMLSKIALKRFSSPQEIANSILFLVSNQSSCIQGTSVYVDGGYLLE